MMEAKNRDDEVPTEWGDAPDTEDGSGDDDTPDVEDDVGDANALVSEDDADVPSFFRLTKKLDELLIISKSVLIGTLYVY